jgi:hypothetical protein
VGEGQLEAGGPLPEPAPVLPYATGLAEDESARWVDLPDGVEFRVPPPAVGRQVVLPAVGLAVAIPVALFGALGTVAAASPGRSGGSFVGALVLGGLTVLAVRFGLRAARRLVRAARSGTRPTVISTSPEWLTLASPWLPEDRPYRLPRASVTGVRLDEVGAAPLVLRVVRLSVVLRNEDLFNLKFPWRANFPLEGAEWRLREALALGPRNFAPPVAPGRRDIDSCESSS